MKARSETPGQGTAMTIPDLAQLGELFRLMNEHGIARVELEGLTVTTNNRLPFGGFLPQEITKAGEGNVEAADDEELLMWSAGQ